MEGHETSTNPVSSYTINWFVFRPNWDERIGHGKYINSPINLFPKLEREIIKNECDTYIILRHICGIHKCGYYSIKWRA